MGRGTQSAAAVAEPMASPGGPRSLLVWLLLLQRWLREAPAGRSATPSPTSPLSGGGLEDPMADQPSPGGGQGAPGSPGSPGAPGAPKLVEFRSGDSSHWPSGGVG